MISILEAGRRLGLPALAGTLTGGTVYEVGKSVITSLTNPDQALAKQQLDLACFAGFMLLVTLAGSAFLNGRISTQEFNS